MSKTARKTNENPVELAQATLSALEQKRARVAAQREKDDREVEAISYHLHTGDKDAAERFEAIRERALKRELELTSIDAAIVTAKQKLVDAKQAEAQAQARKVAKELLTRADAIVALAQSLDDANRVRIDASRAIADTLTEMRSLAHGLGVFVPSHDQFTALGSRAEHTAGMQTPFAREIAEHLPPNYRRDHMSYVAGWRDAIVKSASALVGEDKSNQLHTKEDGSRAA
jgi:hypothetical protein